MEESIVHQESVELPPETPLSTPSLDNSAVDSEAESGSKSESAPEPAPEVKPESQPKSDSDWGTNDDPDWKIDWDVKTEVIPEPESKPKRKPKPKPKSESKSESESEPQPESESASEEPEFYRRRLFVRNIGYMTRRDTMTKFYMRFFSKFGQVDFFDVVWDHLKNVSKGFGFVVFHDVETAQKVLKVKPEELLIPEKGRTLQVYPANRKKMEMIKDDLKRLRKDREELKREKERILAEEERSKTPSPVRSTFQLNEPSPDLEAEKAIENMTLSNARIDEAKALIASKSVAKEPLEETTMMKLADDSLVKIGLYLTIRDRFCLSMVNHRFLSIIDQVWARTYYLSFKDSFPLWSQLSTTKDIADLTTDTLFKILRKVPHLKEMNLYQAASTFDDKFCDVIGRCCPNLEKLVIRDAVLNKYTVTSIGKFCRKLKYLDLTKCDNVVEKGLWGLLNFVPRLERLMLSQCDGITGRCFYLLQNLTYLDVSHCSPALNSSYSRLAQCCKETLTTLIAAPITKDGLIFICGNFLNLERFEVDQTSDQHFPVVRVGVIQGAEYLTSLKKLKKLVFCPELADLDNDVFLRITSSWPLIEDLKLFGTDRVTDRSMVNLSTRCPNLKFLTLEGCKFGDSGLTGFIRLKKLKELKIQGSLVTDAGAYTLMSNIPTLRLLNLNSCPGIGLDTLRAAYELLKSELISPDLILCFNNCRVKVSDLISEDAVQRYASPELWAQDDLADYFGVFDDDDDDDYYNDLDGDNYNDLDDDYIADGDLESEEELT